MLFLCVLFLSYFFLFFLFVCVVVLFFRCFSDRCLVVVVKDAPWWDHSLAFDL